MRKQAPAERRLRRIKSVAALIMFGCIVISVFGTVHGMVRSFNAIALGGSAPIEADLAESIQWSMTLTRILMPATFIAAIVWVGSWYKLRTPLTIGIRSGRLAADDSGHQHKQQNDG
ncbi:hypothetical protein Poly59_30860 [Rubripirellula reticaptiva]|uniref:Uncharacterized protein n=1 Tax=Rubripirellula reticaptiva TaxID=2528013 RepID=A0A5C6ESZ8_9BACT|nr:hypothetical protein Poly59_30520 [Rubripirellula reticaptiva]TWU51494.1 hypothetical protein Poly59_30860 [Rubripirellula reticaptiva]